MALYSQTHQKIGLRNVASSGEDVRAMRACLMQMGVQFDDYDSRGEILLLKNPTDFHLIQMPTNGSFME